MHTFVTKGLLSAAFAGGIVLLGNTAAQAADQDTTGADSVLGGTQVAAPVAAPVDLTGNSLSILGDAVATQPADPAPAQPVEVASAPSQQTSGSDAVVSGTQASAPVQAPVEVSNNSISVLGDASTQAQPAAEQTPATTPEPVAQTTDGANGTASGTQVAAPVTAPVDVTGNAISVTGDAVSDGSSESSPAAMPSTSTPQQTTGEDALAGGSQVSAPVTAPVDASGNAVSLLGDAEVASAPSASASGSTAPIGAGEQSTGGEGSLAGGTQVTAPVILPIDLSGNSITVFGDAESGSTDPASTQVTGTSGSEQMTTGEDSIAGGSQVSAPVTAPIDLSGNSITIFGDASSATGSNDSTSTPTATDSEQSTTGADGIASGTQVGAPITAPIDLSGNSISVFGDGVTESQQGEVSTPASGSTEGQSTSGSDSLIGGTQVGAPVNAPVNLSGNSISLLGDAATVTETGTQNSSPTVGDSEGSVTDGTDSTLGGTQVTLPVTAPVQVGGNAIAVLGDATSSTTTGTGSTVPNGGSASDTDGQDSVAGGSQIISGVLAPIGLNGNAISLTGDAQSEQTGSTDVTPGQTGSNTSGGDSILGGSQIVLPVQLPLDLSGNAITITGDAQTGTTPLTPVVPSNPVVPGEPATPGTPVVPGTPTEPTTPSSPVASDFDDSFTLSDDPISVTAVPNATMNSNDGAVMANIVPSQMMETLASTGGSLGLIGLAIILLISGLLARRASAMLA